MSHFAFRDVFPRLFAVFVTICCQFDSKFCNFDIFYALLSRKFKFFAINSEFTLDTLSNSTYLVFLWYLHIHVKTETSLIKE